MIDISVFLLFLTLRSLLPELPPNRIQLVSQDIVWVAKEELHSNGLRNISDINTAISLVTGAMVGESGMREDIENCSVSGDHGRSIGLGQLMNGPNWRGFSRKQICSSRILQIHLSLSVLDTCYGKSKNHAAVFRCYTSGSINKNSFIARKEYSASETVKSCFANYRPTTYAPRWSNYYADYLSRSSMIL